MSLRTDTASLWIETGPEQPEVPELDHDVETDVAVLGGGIVGVTTALLLKDIAKTRSVVVVEHDMSFVRELGTRVTCLAEGSVLAEGSLDQVSQNPVVIERYLGR